MLTAELKINGKLIGHLYIVNKGFAELPSVTDAYASDHIYNYEYYEVGSKKAPKTGSVIHNRDNGALKLISICAMDMGL